MVTVLREVIKNILKRNTYPGEKTFGKNIYLKEGCPS
jgi:hypothetical protein